MPFIQFKIPPPHLTSPYTEHTYIHTPLRKTLHSKVHLASKRAFCFNSFENSLCLHELVKARQGKLATFLYPSVRLSNLIYLSLSGKKGR